MKKLSLCLVLFFLLALMPTAVPAAESILQNGTFETEELLWNHGEICPGKGLDATCGLVFSFPVPKIENTFLHYTAYSAPIAFDSSSVYSLSFKIRTDIAGDAALPPSCSLLPTSAKSINVQVQNVEEAWKTVSVVFMVSSSAKYELALMIDSPYEDATFFIDDMLLSTVDFVPTRMAIEGRKSVSVPTFGEASYSYFPVVLDAEGNTCNIQNASISAKSPLPNGVSFDTETATLRVSSEAPLGESIELQCTPPEGNHTLSSVSMHITLSGNLLQNGSFEELPRYIGWDMESFPFSIREQDGGNAYAVLEPHTTFGDMSVSSIESAYSFFLQAENMYVFRARLFAEGASSASDPETQALPPDEEGVIRIQAANFSTGRWVEVMSAFYVPTDGIYSIVFDFFSENAASVLVDDMKVQPEVPAPSGVYVDAPAHISIPAEGTSHIALPYLAFSQIGLPIEAEVAFSVYPDKRGVSFNKNVLSVSETATQQTYTLSAFLKDDPSVKKEYAVQITNESVGDGSFEREEVGTWWKTASPSLLQYVSTFNGAYPAEGSRFARLTMNGSVSALMSNSVAQYSKGTSYVFEANMKITVPDIATVVTVLVDNMESDSFDDNLVIGQFTLSNSMQRVQKLFTPSETVSGRLMIAFNTPETHEQQIVLLDMISIPRATVSASAVRINGTPFLDKIITGSYHFSSNFDAINSSSFRWLIANAADGIFMPLESETTDTLSITEEMLGKYLKFEVTPISLSGPVVGASIASQAILVGEPIPSTDDFTDEEVTGAPSAPSPSPSQPSAPLGMQVLELRDFAVADKHHFFDLAAHWAKTEVEHLTAAGVVEGRGNGLYEPEALVTRAEFSAILARAFTLAPIYYEGQFTDVKPFSWYSGAIAVVTKYGIAQGTGEKTFSPDLPITREEIAVMLMRAYRKTGAPVKTAPVLYTDAAEISPWALGDLAESGALGLLNGMTDGTFRPKRNATRAEAAVMIYRMLSVLSENYN